MSINLRIKYFIAILQKVNPKFKNTIDKAVDYIVKNLDGLEDPYAIAISSYALHLAEHPSKDQAFHLLEEKAKTEGKQKFIYFTLYKN